MQYRTLTQAEYEAYRFDLLRQLEGLRLAAYNDTHIPPIPTIGIGFNLRTSATQNYLRDLFGFDLTDTADQAFWNRLVTEFNATHASTTALQQALNQIMSERAAQLGGRTTFSFYDEAEASAALNVLAAGEEAAVTSFYSAASLPQYSWERLALLSLKYTGILGQNTLSYLQSGDRAEVWAEIRYGSNGDGDHGKRRYVEAAVFGLFAGPQATADEAEDAAQMFQRRRQQIEAYESTYGNLIDDANLELAAANILAPFVLSIIDELEPAKAHFLTTIAAQDPDRLVTAFQGIAATDMFVGDRGTSNILDTSLDSSSLARANNDLLIGQDLMDNLTGGDGDDVLAGRAGADLLFGGAGNDLLFGDAGADYVYGNDGDDLIEGGDEDDELTGGAGADQLHGGGGVDLMYGGAGNDIINGLDGGSGDTLEGGAGRDKYFIDDGDEIIDSGDGGEIFYGTQATRLTGGYRVSGETNYTSSDGAFVYALQQDGSVLVTTPTGQLTIRSSDLATLGIDLFDAPTDPPQIVASGPSQTIHVQGDASVQLVGGSNVVTGDGGIQTAGGSSGDDYYDLGAGNDFMQGRSGNDTYVYDQGYGRDVINMGTDDAIRGYEQVLERNVIHIGPGLTPADLDVYHCYGFFAGGFHGGSLEIRVRDSAEDSIVITGLFTDVRDDEWDLILGEVLSGSWSYFPGDPAGVDDFLRIEFSNGVSWGLHQLWNMADQSLVTDNVLWGGGGNDFMFGGTGYDYLSGEDGDDNLEGGTGNDTLFAGGGNDRLIGGAGDDDLYGKAGYDQLEGGAGNDGIFEASEQDTLIFGRGDGQDRVWLAQSAGRPNVRMREGIAVGDVYTYTIGDDFVLAISGTSDRIRIVGGALVPTSPIAAIEFADGTILNLDQSTLTDLAGSESEDVLAAGGTATRVQGFGGNDTLTGSEFADVVEGGSGDDALFGLGGDDQLIGGDGEDVISGGSGADWIDGGGGNDLLIGGDSIVAATAGGDTFVFGRGYGEDLIRDLDDGTAQADTIRFLEGIAPGDLSFSRVGDDLHIAILNTTDSLAIGGWFLSSAHRIETVTFADGTEWDLRSAAENMLLGGVVGDSLAGTAGGDALFGFDGDDTLTGNHGDDHLSGGEGTDVLEGGAGDDLLLGGAGADVLDGGSGNDGYDGGIDDSTAPADTIVFGYGSGADVVRDIDGGGTGIGELKLGVGVAPQDLLTWQEGDDRIFEIRDTGDRITFQGWYLNVSYRPERVTFSDGTTWNAQSFVVQTGNDVDNVIDGTVADDQINGGDGQDTLSGSVGDDTLNGQSGNDTLNGGSGNDELTGGAGADTLRGNRGADLLDGGAGDDLLVGNDAGYDVAGDVYVFGLGYGHDTIQVDNISTDHNDTLRLLSGVAPGELLSEQQGADRIFTIAGTADRITISDWYSGTRYRIQRVEFADGTVWDVDDLSRNIINGMSGADSLLGTFDPDEIHALGGDDFVSGDGGDDVLYGDAGNDSLFGDAGNDTLQGGGGDDSLSGDAGDDRYRFAVGDGHDLISSHDAVSTSDSLELVGIVYSDILIYQRNNRLILEVLSTGDSVTIDNWRLESAYRVDRLQFGDGTVWADFALRDVFPILGDDQDNFETASDSNDTIELGEGNDYVEALSGDDLIDGGTGDDTLVGGQGNDIYIVDSEFDGLIELASQGTDEVRSSLTWTLLTNFENLTLLGSANIDGTGNSVANTVTGNAGDNLLDGKGGADTLSGGAGSDTYVVDNAGDTVVENAGEGVDQIRSSVTFTLGDNIENLTLTGSAAVNATGNALDNVLTGNSGNNVMSGGLGNDTYVVAQAGDSVVEGANEGTDLVQSSVTYTLQANVENLTLTGSSGIGGTGNELDNIIIGNGGANALNGAVGDDTLDGGAGADSLTGGQGDDIYVVDHATDAVVEAAAEGLDTVRASVTHTLANNVENLTLTGVAAINGTGNGLGNVLTGNSAANTLNGGTGADTLMGNQGDDTYVVDDVLDSIIENADEGTDSVQSSVTYGLATNVENLTLTGAAAVDGTGNALNNVLIGNSAANILTGGAGNDTYVVGSGDSVVEASGEGNDLVQSAITWTLAANVENLTLTGSGAVNATGNELDNLLTGNTGANQLTGGAGNDKLEGGASADQMTGGTGDDLYIVDDAGDTINELTGEGIDSVEASVTYTLSNFVDNLTLVGGSAINGTGNTLNNILVGNNAANTLSGGAGVDTMVGGLGNDTYVVDDVGDAVTESAGAGTDTVQSTISYTLGANLENITLTGSGAINATGNELNNTLRANSGANVLTGGAGNDTYVVAAGDTVVEASGEGIDTVQSSVTSTLAANVENLTLTGSGAINATGNELDNVLTGNTGVNQLAGGAGNDTLDGGASADQMIGGTGDDLYIVDAAGETITENASEGTDTVQSSVAFTLSNFVENLTLTGISAINGTGNALDNVLVGNSMANTLNGGAGADTMSGGAANDIYVVDDAGDVVVEIEAEGTDTVQSSISYALGANVENLTLTGSTAINASGNELNNTLTGNTGVNVLSGGLGNDTYVVGAGDSVVEGANEGVDLVQSTISWTLAANVENLTLTGSAAVDATGNELDNVLTGNTGANVLTGGTGNDTYVVGAGDSVIENPDEGIDTIQSAATWTLGASVENLTLTGSAAANATGNALNNVLTGNTGTNLLTGGLGDDTYVVGAGDSVVEVNGEGIDTVQSSVAYTLGANLENLTLTGSGAVNATGNALDNVLTGNTGANVLTGGAGNDTYVTGSADSVVEVDGEGIDTVQSSVTHTLSNFVENLSLTGTGNINATGNALANLLTGNAGNNTLSGAAGADTMSGGLGNDTYVVDDVGDVIVEDADAGVDLVQAAISYGLSANVESLTLTGSALVDGTGNELDNVLTGNTANNTLSGGAGNDTLNGGSGTDTMIGGAGDDTYVVAQSGDVVTELDGEGVDLVQASVTHTLSGFVENLTLTGGGNISGTGNNLDNILSGNTGNNTLTGGAGSDVIDGGAGTDTMVGGTGDDTYYSDVFGETITEAADEGVDRVYAGGTHVLQANVELLFLTGTTQIDGTGNALSNLLRGNSARNILVGGGGNDVLEGGEGNDSLSNTAASIFNGGNGNDSITGSSSHDFLIGGAGNDAINTGAGRDVIAFNLGDGADTISASTTRDNTLSIGGGATYEDLLFQRTGNNLVLRVGATDQITFTNYYASASNHSINTLQLLIEGTSDYDVNSSDQMHNKKVETFDFEGLVVAFDAARTADPMLTSWSLTNALLAQHLSGSDTEALGGDLAYQYGRFGSLSDMSMNPALAILTATNYGQSAQTLQSGIALHDESLRLS